MPAALPALKQRRTERSSRVSAGGVGDKLEQLEKRESVMRERWKERELLLNE